MEFTIDFALVRRIIAQESRQARNDIAALGPLRAYQGSLSRQDERLAAAGDADTLACQAGCSWCCHFSVDVRPVEVLNIVEFMRRTFTSAELQRLRQEIETNSAIFAPLDEMQRMQRNIKCPFLMEGRCSIYAARPQTCRNYHATDVTGCRQSFEQPDDMDIAPDYAPLVYQSGASHVEAFAQALSEAGYDLNAYELNTALAEALADPVAIQQRFDNKLPVFIKAEGMEVPMEFVDAD
ncbi:MAG: YkgJ family cysteine cluster protein [Steroidobacteraceae bacterium]